jgi:hypothetical protein
MAKNSISPQSDKLSSIKQKTTTDKDVGIMEPLHTFHAWKISAAIWKSVRQFHNKAKNRTSL